MKNWIINKLDGTIDRIKAASVYQRECVYTFQDEDGYTIAAYFVPNIVGFALEDNLGSCV